MGFSIIIPVKAINDYIRESVPIILSLDYADFEVIILPNERPMEPLPEALTHAKVRILATGKVSPAVKRDLGAAQSRYPYLAFIDDDAYPEPGWLREAEKHFADPTISAIGGPAVTPRSASLREQASGLFYETLAGGGGLAFRYRPIGKEVFVDDFPTVNLLVRKKAFDAIGGFDSAFWPGEDTKFCHDLVQAGHKILYVPSVVVWHHRRSVFQAHLKQIAGYGRHRGYFAKILPRTSRRFVYFMPSVFLLGNVSLGTLGFVTPWVWGLWCGLLLVYALFIAMDVGARTRHPRLFMLTSLAIPLSHLTYGGMFLIGFFARSRFQSQLR